MRDLPMVEPLHGVFDNDDPWVAIAGLHALANALAEVDREGLLRDLRATHAEQQRQTRIPDDS